MEIFCAQCLYALCYVSRFLDAIRSITKSVFFQIYGLTLNILYGVCVTVKVCAPMGRFHSIEIIIISDKMF